jgi:uncharacterized protein VirK/YbjX
VHRSVQTAVACPQIASSKASAATWTLYYRAVRLIFSERRSLRPVTRFLIRGLLYPAPTLRVLRYFDVFSSGFSSPRVNVDSLLKVGRQHVRRGLSAGERADLLVAHYETLTQSLSRTVLRSFLDGNPIRLAGMTGRDGGDEYEIALSQTPFSYRREGEMTLSMRSCVSGLRLADLTFTIGPASSGTLALRIGGIQGPPALVGKTAIKAATKSLDGLRPKAVVVEVMYQLGRYFGARTIFATSLSFHVLYGKKAPLMRLAAYDGFWEEMGGVRLACGDYQLPAAPPHRPAGEVPGKRRKAWERRQHLISLLESEVLQTMASIRPVRPPGSGKVPAELLIQPQQCASAAFGDAA